MDTTRVGRWLPDSSRRPSAARGTAHVSDLPFLLAVPSPHYIILFSPQSLGPRSRRVLASSRFIPRSLRPFVPSSPRAFRVYIIIISVCACSASYERYNMRADRPSTPAQHNVYNNMRYKTSFPGTRFFSYYISHFQRPLLLISLTCR